MWTETERQEMLKKAEERQIILNTSKKEKELRVIEATNLMADWLKQIQEFLTLNESRLIGKQLFKADGTRTKYFDSLLNEILDTFNLGRWENCYIVKGGGNTELKMSIAVFGGKKSYENDGVNTKYNITVSRTVYNLIKYSACDFKYESIDTKAMLKKYTYEAYINAQKEVDEINEQIKELETKRSNVKHEIPSALQS